MSEKLIKKKFETPSTLNILYALRQTGHLDIDVASALHVALVYEAKRRKVDR